MPDPHLPFSDQEPVLPSRLASDLAGLFNRAVPIPAHIDESILANARRRLWVLRFRRRLIRWSPLTAAAALLLIVYAYRPVHGPTRPLVQGGPETSAPADGYVATDIREDLNRDGHVDILDAFALARHLRRNDALEPTWDLTGDGRVDHADVDRIAHRAVALIGGPPS